MKLFLIIFISILSGCATNAPITSTFPNAPPTLLEKCKNLGTIDSNDILLSELIKKIVDNYTISRECSEKYDGWIDWYKTQKKIFDNIK